MTEGKREPIGQGEALEARARELLAAEVEQPDAGSIRLGGDPSVPAKSALRAITAALHPHIDHAVGGLREQVRELQQYGAYMPLIVREKFLEEASAITAALSASQQPVKQDAVREALSECADKLWIARCDSRDASFREAAERACEMADRALKRPHCSRVATPPLDNTVGPDAGTDTTLLNALRDECWELRCFNSPTGGGDYDVNWRVVGHWEAEPQERVIAYGWSDDPRVAIRAALVARGQS